ASACLQACRGMQRPYHAVALDVSGYDKNAPCRSFVLPLLPRRAATVGSRAHRKWRGAAPFRGRCLLVRQDAGPASDDDPALDGRGRIERLQGCVTMSIGEPTRVSGVAPDSEPMGGPHVASDMPASRPKVLLSSGSCRWPAIASALGQHDE